MVFAQKKTVNTPLITADEILGHTKILAADNLKGRLTGTKECDKAAAYIESEFKSYGLKPAFGKSFYQDFPFVFDVEMTKNNSITFTTSKKVKLKAKSEFITAPFSGNVKTEGELVFVGYGISAPKLKYDDYEGIDVTGKTVIALRYNPEFDNPHSEFDEYSSFRKKASVAKEKGARAIIFVNGPLPESAEDKLMEFKYDRAAGIDGIGVLHVKRKFIEELFSSRGLNLKEIQQEISKNKKPKSFSFDKTGCFIQTEIKEIKKTGKNVAGLIEGTDPLLKNEYLVIGAHYDHLGMGVTGSLYRGTDPQIHNGADDNASGTAGILELAEIFASKRKEIKRSIIIVAFSGEELGLLGSAHFVANSPIPTEKMVSMINLDMIGRLNDESSLIVYGTGTSSVWKTMVDSLNKGRFKLTKNEEGYGPSDHSSFYAKNIPVLFFFTGTHSDYHRPTDDYDKINVTGEEKILQYVYEIAYAIQSMDNKPDYVNVPRKSSENRGGWKVYVGTIPDYAYSGKGLKITGVNEGSPAKKAGLQGGDIILKFGSKNIENIYDYVYALQDHVPGDLVDLIVKRNNQELKLTLELGAK